MAVVVTQNFSETSTSSSGGGGGGGNSVTKAKPERLVPDFQIKINGQPLSPLLDDALNMVEIRQSVRLVDMAILGFENEDGYISDDPVFKKGNDILIEVGYVGEVAWAFKGEIVSIEPDFQVAASPTCVVRAYDKLHRYRRGRHQRTFLNQKVSDVVSSIASEEGLTPDVEDTKVTHEYLLQNNQTNADFIHELARRYGYEVDVTDEASKLRFRKARSDKGKAHSLKWGEDLKSFQVRKSVGNVPTEVRVRYWDMKSKKHVLEKSKDLHGKLKPKDEAAKEAKKAFGDAVLQISLRPGTAPAAAKAMAWSIFNEQALNSVQGRGTCGGEPAILPGIVMELSGLGKTWSGLYYVWAATHVLDRSAGYSTSFDVRRTGTGWNEPLIPHKKPPAPAWEPAQAATMGATVEREEQAAAPAEEEKQEKTKSIKLKFKDEDGDPFVGKPFELEAGGKTITGSTSADGKITADVSADATSGEVTIWLDDDKSGDSYSWPITISD